MAGTVAIPIVTAGVAIVALLAIGARYKGRPAASLWPLLVPIAIFSALAGYWAFRHAAGSDAAALEALRLSAIGVVAVVSMALLVLGVRAGTRFSNAPNTALASRAMWVGFGLLALLAIAWGGDRKLWVAVAPSAIGVLGVALGARGLETTDEDSESASRAAFEVLVVIVLALGAVALAAIAAASLALAHGVAIAEVRAVLTRASVFAVPPVVAATVVLAGRLAPIGLGVVGRFGELSASVLIVVAAAAALRVDLGRLMGRPPVAIAPPAPTATSAPIAAKPAPPAPVPPSAGAAANVPPAAAMSLPEISFGRVRVSGMLAPNEVRRGVERIRPRLEKCYASSSDPGRQGELTVKFSIAGSGSVSSVQKDDSSSVTNEKFVECVLASFYQIGFPQPTRGHVRVEAPIQIGQPP